MGAADVDALLRSARAAAGGQLALPPARASRTAALLARTALEDAVWAACRRAGFAAAPRPTARSQFVCLRVLVDREIGSVADATWATLSRACHQHAYELAPAPVEVAHLIDEVDRIVDILRTAVRT